jgi:hypothetical protein
MWRHYDIGEGCRFKQSKSHPEIIGKCAADLRVKRFEGRTLVCCYDDMRLWHDDEQRERETEGTLALFRNVAPVLGPDR